MPDASTRLRALAAAGGLLAVLVLAGACATPIGVTRADTQAAYRDLARSVLSTGETSAGSEIVLRREGLAARYDADPVATLAALRGTGRDLSQDRLFALAELSFLYARAGGRPRTYYLAAAVYAYAFMMDRKALDRGRARSAHAPRRRHLQSRCQPRAQPRATGRER